MLKSKMYFTIFMLYIAIISLLFYACPAPVETESKPSPPRINILLPTNGQTVSTNIMVYGSVSGKYTITGVYLCLNSGSYSTVNLSGNQWFTNLYLTAGSNYIYAYAKDIKDNYSSTNSIVLIADDSYPFVVITSPTNNQRVETNFTLSGIAWDDISIEGVYLSVDGSAYSKVNGTTSWSTNLIVSKATHTLQVYARDNSSHDSAIYQVVVYPMAEQNPFVQAKRLGRGVNMGNCLEAYPNEGSWGVRIEDNYFQLIKQAGFNSVRIPIRWSAHAQTNSPYTIDSEFFTRVDNVISNALANNLVTVINVHHYEELATSPDAHFNRLIALWQQIADRYKDKPDSLYFELLNEPNGALDKTKWNSWIPTLISTIRSIDPTRTIVVGGVNWNSIDGLYDLNWPTNTNLIATFHFYDPFIFTHQTATWSDPSIANLSNVIWPNQIPDPTNTVPMPSGAPSWIADQINYYNAHSDNLPGSKKDISNRFAQVSNWAASHDCPVWIGEFGSYSGVNNSTDMDSRVKWTGYVRTTAEKFGFVTAYWEFCAGFGIYPYKDGPWISGLTNALLSNW